MSARVGSIGDNQLGGWYSYRASKTALNQLTKTMAIECSRRKTNVSCIMLHPGTVDTDLSVPFQKVPYCMQPHVAVPLQQCIAWVMNTANQGFCGILCACPSLQSWALTITVRSWSEDQASHSFAIPAVDAEVLCCGSGDFCVPHSRTVSMLAERKAREVVYKRTSCQAVAGNN